jgi:hypothetical protein
MCGTEGAMVMVQLCWSLAHLVLMVSLFFVCLSVRVSMQNGSFLTGSSMSRSSTLQLDTIFFSVVPISNPL